MTPLQLRAARALADWSQSDLAKHSGTSTDAVRNFESRGSDPKQGTILKWKGALERAGVQFIEPGMPWIDGGPGVRLLKNK